MNDKPTFRFAPSPNGALHLGHAYSAILNFELAKRVGADFLVRVEDIDTARCTPQLEAAMFDDLAWLGLEWEQPVLRQSERFGSYQEALDSLRDQELIYPSFLSRGEIKQHVKEHPAWPRDPDGAALYPGLEREWSEAERATAMKSGKPYAWRLDMKQALSLYPIEGAEAWGDVVLGRKETPTSYHLSVVIDDAAQGVTHVVRGHDLEASTSIHLLLQKMLNLPSPDYKHHRLILDEQGERLSKSVKSTALKALRDDGASVADIHRLIGWNDNEVDAYL
ncbi:MAG: tRNA glutamyl-Q(34) synthetase GluQRS [Hyphomicrobiales bacterium]